MIFNIVLLILLAVITYFHYAQGLLTSTFSAISAILAAVLALSYHEQLVAFALKANMPDQAHAIALVVLFAATYSILRVIFDKAVPGNIHVPLMVERIGAAAMGLVAAVFALGIVTIAAQSLPFGPNIAGLKRYPLTDNPDIRGIPGGGQSNVDAFVSDVMADDHFEPAKATGPLIPVDDAVIGTVKKLSNGGSLAGERTWDSIHPDYPNELFASRLGIQTGARHVALNLPSGEQQVDVSGIFSLPQIAQVDAEIEGIRGKEKVLPKQTIKPDAGQSLLVFRTTFGGDAADTDGKVRVSTGSVRLLGVHEEGSTKTYVNYTPLGTLENASILLANKPDDPLVVTGGGPVDFVILVNNADVGLAAADPKSGGGDRKLANGVFLEVKRLARVDLSGKPVGGPPPAPDKKGGVMRKLLNGGKDFVPPPAAGQAPAPQQAPEGSTPLTVGEVTLSSQLFTPVNAGQYQGDLAEISTPAGKATVKTKKFAKLDFAPSAPITQLAQGDNAFNEVFVPEGVKMVQVAATPPVKSGSDPWAWAGDLASFELVDQAGTKYKPQGAWAKVKQGTDDKLLARYDSDAPVASVSKSEGRPTEVWVVYLVPEGSKLASLNYKGAQVKALTLEVK